MLRLNTKRFAADLMLTTGRHEIEEDIPYFAIEPIRSGEKRPSTDNRERAEPESEATAV